MEAERTFDWCLANDICPKCRTADLDTGYECTDEKCGFDALPLVAGSQHETEQ